MDLRFPGMPIASPGMEVTGREPQTCDVISFGNDEPQTFLKFLGGTKL